MVAEMYSGLDRASLPLKSVRDRRGFFSMRFICSDDDLKQSKDKHMSKLA